MVPHNKTGLYDITIWDGPSFFFNINFHITISPLIALFIFEANGKLLCIKIGIWVKIYILMIIRENSIKINQLFYDILTNNHTVLYSIKSAKHALNWTDRSFTSSIRAYLNRFISVALCIPHMTIVKQKPHKDIDSKPQDYNRK